MSSSLRVSSAVYTTTSSPSSTPTYIDVGVNLLDTMFSGVYNEKKYHEVDLDAVLSRASEIGLVKLLVTASDLYDSVNALRLCRKVNNSGKFPTLRLHSTVGVHPTSTTQFEGVAGSRHGGAAVDDTTTSSSTTTTTGPPPSPSSSEIPSDEDFLLPSTFPASKEEYIKALRDVIQNGIKDGTVVAIGECGLDYDRLHFSPKEVQKRHFGLHFDLAEEFGLPLFLHNRNTGGDFVSAMREVIPRLQDAITKKRMKEAGGALTDTSTSSSSSTTTTEITGSAASLVGVVHSFTGSSEECKELLDLGLYIGINGCSLKTEENCQVAATIPLSHLLLETDAPWCGVKATHFSNKFVQTRWNQVKRDKYGATLATAASVVRDRNEPCQIVQVAEVMAGLKKVSVKEIADAALENTRVLFNI